jgi:predicted small secreted protein
MSRTPLTATALLLGALALSACATAEGAGEDISTAMATVTGATEGPPEGYQKVSDLVALPEFLPGIGVLYVDPATLPAGPFLAYDREGNLVSTVYMVPVERLQAQETFDNLEAAEGAEVDHVDLYYNAGHPGVEQPHYHIVLWHVAEENRVAAAQ